MTFPQFLGTEQYIADDALMADVNAAIVLQKPLLVRGEPGTGKTMLAKALAESIQTPLISWHIKSTTKAKEGLYQYDVVQRLNDSRFGGGDVSNIEHYIKMGPLGRAFQSNERVIVLIDEIDKADIEFPNDLLRELDEMSFYIPETDQTIAAKHRPIILITSNAEKELPDAFLRRCLFHYISFPTPERMQDIVHSHFENLDQKVLNIVLQKFYKLRTIDGLRKKPSTSELIDWLTVLIQMGVDVEKTSEQYPFLSTLIKREQDIHTIKNSYRRRY
jgi:MoxR-like ATPase